MSNNLKMVIAFVSGAFVGGVITKIVVDKKHEKEDHERYTSLVEYYESDREDIPENPVLSVEEDGSEFEQVNGTLLEKYKQPSLKELAKRLEQHNIDYTSYSKKKRASDLEDSANIEKLDLIKPDESSFQILDFDIDEVPHGYESEAYSLYADGVLTDSYGEVVEYDDQVQSVGVESVQTLMREQAGIVMYVKNTANRTLYEITKEDMTYEQAYHNGPEEED